MFKKLAAGFVTILAFSRLVSAQSSGPEQAGPYQTLVIRGVTIVDGSGAPAFGPADIFVQGNRITRVALTDAITREEEKTDANADRSFPRADNKSAGQSGHSLIRTNSRELFALAVSKRQMHRRTKPQGIWT